MSNQTFIERFLKLESSGGILLMFSAAAALIIALFYTAKISLSALISAAIFTAVLFLLNRRKVDSKSMYLFVGVIMWVSLLKSSVHATLVGVVRYLVLAKSLRKP